jgi:ABC-type transporter Mla subunit MlaD
MQSNAARFTIAGVLVVAVVLFIVLKGSGDNGTTTTSTSTGDVATIKVVNGQPVGGVQDLTFTEGDDIRFRVDSDVSDEVHFHGYDIGKDVKAGGSVTFDVPATITGKFEVELESRVTQLAEITVNPS